MTCAVYIHGRNGKLPSVGGTFVIDQKGYSDVIIEGINCLRNTDMSDMASYTISVAMQKL